MTLRFVFINSSFCFFATKKGVIARQEGELFLLGLAVSNNISIFAIGKHYEYTDNYWKAV